MKSNEPTRESAEDPSARNAGLQSVLPDDAPDAIETARLFVGPLPPTPVETLDDLDIAHRLRLILTDERTPDLLRRVYRELRECIDTSALINED